MNCLPRRRRPAARTALVPCTTLPRPRRTPALDVRYALTLSGHTALEASR